MAKITEVYPSFFMKLPLMLLSFLFFTSCVKEITMPDYGLMTQPSMNAVVKGGELITVYLFENGTTGGGELNAVNNALVEVWNDGIMIDSVSNADEGEYETEVEAEFGKDYEIRATIDGKTMSSSFRVPSPPVLIEATHIPFGGVDDEGAIYPGVEVVLERSRLNDAYYEVVIWLDTYDNLRPAEFYFLRDPFIVREGLPLALFSDEGVSEESFSVFITYTTNSHSGDAIKTYPFFVELRSVTEDYYHYRRSFYLNMNSQEELEPGLENSPADLFSNVKGGSGRVVSYSSVVSELLNVD
ncbi:DUF4249 family protein [Alkalitalea saponilacus]|uniref:DUF4249 domain-containing protein n=1 Tax=Alkalitalea saponilacus TaxID=889453 RepID=A0A1T5AWX6_9BACT|nr:DUF4249 family protein [Alkalitalea saponilacus]ASB48568.1 hypothetical protein CDL62_05150 [Alkalitalea saponilacus]SKB39465.1 protein of unknown function [Alkalitalea saponilacus]